MTGNLPETFIEANIAMLQKNCMVIAKFQFGPIAGCPPKNRA